MPITQSVMEDQCTNDEGDLAADALHIMAQFSTRLGLILVDTCKGEPYRIVESAGHGNGLEAWRLLMRRYASRTPGTKRALLASLFSMKPAISASDFESVLLTVEEIIRRYDAMSVTKMPEDIQCAILIAVCPKDLKEFLDMSTEDFKYVELRNRATNWIERKRDQHSKHIHDMERKNTGHAPMDVSWFGEWPSEEDWHDSEIQGVQDWGGYTPQPSNPEYSWTDEVQFMHKGYKGKSKGKGKHGKGHFTGKGTGTRVLTGSSYGKGAGTQVFTGSPSFKGSSKGVWKGSSKGKSQFNGECHYCGKWGHTARECTLKDAHMAQWRQSTQTASVEDQTAEHDHECDHDNDNHVSALETSGGHRNMGTWELSNLMTHIVPVRAKHVTKSQDQILHTLIEQNPFAALSNEESEADSGTGREPVKIAAQFPSEPKLRREWKAKVSTEPGPTEVASLSEYPWITKVSQGTRKKWKRRQLAQMPVLMESEPEACRLEPFQMDVETAEISNVESRTSRNDGKRIQLTIDSGAAEHVVGPKDIPHIPIAP